MEVRSSRSIGRGWMLTSGTTDLRTNRSGITTVSTRLAEALAVRFWKNHIFAFFSYEELRNSGRDQTANWYETPAYDALVAQAKKGGISAAVAGYPGESVDYQSVASGAKCAFAGLSSTHCHDVTANGIFGLDLGRPLNTALGAHNPSYVNNGAPGIGEGSMVFRICSV